VREKSLRYMVTKTDRQKKRLQHLPSKSFTNSGRAFNQGLTLVQFPAQRKHLLWDGGV